VDEEILTPEEVARYLRVSERTVYNWAQKGELPAGKIGTSWRFRKADIEKWVDGKISGLTAKANTNGVQIERILSEERVLFVKGRDKRGALNELVDCLAGAPQVNDGDELRREIFNREELMSTGIGHGIAIPHVRIASVTDLVGAVGISSEGIQNYQSLDDEPVRILIMLAAAYDQHAKYLKALSYISAKLKKEEIRNILMRSGDARAVYDLLTLGEQSLREDHGEAE
jgi:PTS system nitrogen regulatory IIA component